jgi:topoisomerase-4 subunit A
MMVSKIQDKVFMGKDILHVGIYRKTDDRLTFNLIYLDGASGRAMVKRFQPGGVTRDREYDLTKGTKGSKTLYLTANPNGEAEIVTVYLTQGAKARVKVFDFDFADLDIKGRGAGGNILTRYPVRKVQLKMEGVSTLGGLDIYYDPVVGRLNTDERGNLIGNFLGEDRILVCYKSGDYELTNFELTNRYEPNDVLLIEKFDPEKVLSAVYYDGGSKNYFVKRFQIETTTLNKKFNFITDHRSSALKLISSEKQPQVKAIVTKGKEEEEQVYDLDMIIDVKGWKAMGNKLSSYPIKSLELIAQKKEEKQSSKEEGKDEDSDELEIGSTVDLSPKKDSDEEQLGLF